MPDTSVSLPMDQSSSQSVLFAIGDTQLRSYLHAALQQYGFPYTYEIVGTLWEAQTSYSARPAHCVVLTKDLALGDSGDATGLIDFLPTTQPTVTLTCGDGYPAYWYIPGTYHTWLTIPFDVEELAGRIARVVDRAAHHDES